MERLQVLAEGYLRRNCTRVRHTDQRPRPGELSIRAHRMIDILRLQVLDHLLLSPELDAHHALPINFLHLADAQLELAKAVLVAPMLTLEVLDQALNNVQCCEAEAASQRNGGAQVQVKEHAHVRIHSLPSELWPAGQLSMCHPTIRDVCAAHIGKLITVSGTAVRVGAVKMFEYKKVTQQHSVLRLHGSQRPAPAGCFGFTQTTLCLMCTCSASSAAAAIIAPPCPAAWSRAVGSHCPRAAPGPTAHAAATTSNS